MDKKYRIWEMDKSYGDVLYDRAVGKRDEMESAKALCKIISPLYKKKMKLLDVGCGAGHYLRSLRIRIDKDINYTGTDVTEYYINRAKEAFNDIPFYVGDIYNISFDDNSFDIVTCNNVILHLPPPPIKAISELLRVSSKYVIIRMLFGIRNYIIKEVKGSGLIDDNGEPVVWNYFNIYTIPYIKSVIKNINKSASIEIVDDIFWDNLEDPADSSTSTKVIDGKQVSGNIVLDWKFVIIKKKEVAK